METKTFEVRDSATFIPCIGISMVPTVGENVADFYLLRRAGYGSNRCIVFGRLDGRDFSHDPYDRPRAPRTLQVAHAYVEEHWDELQSGDVIDVEYILGEKPTIKVSERVERI